MRQKDHAPGKSDQPSAEPEPAKRKTPPQGYTSDIYRAMPRPGAIPARRFGRRADTP